MRYALVLALLVGCSHASSTSDAKLLTDRNWMDVWPTSKDEQLHVFRFTPSMGGGVYQDRTLFKGTFELFTYRVDGDAIVFVLPDTGEKVRSRFRIEHVDGPKPFDLRLTLDDSPRGPSVYYGRSAEKASDALTLGE
jgi:hypothetical protein